MCENVHVQGLFQHACTHGNSCNGLALSHLWEVTTRDTMHAFCLDFQGTGNPDRVQYTGTFFPGIWS